LQDIESARISQEVTERFYNLSATRRQHRQTTDPISAHHQRLIARDRTLEVVGFHTGDQANVFQRRKLLLGFGGLPEHQIEFTEVLVRAAAFRRVSPEP
jgi:hypothetical protein